MVVCLTVTNTFQTRIILSAKTTLIRGPCLSPTPSHLLYVLSLVFSFELVKPGTRNRIFRTALETFFEHPNCFRWRTESQIYEASVAFFLDEMLLFSKETIKPGFFHLQRRANARDVSFTPSLSGGKLTIPYQPLLIKTYLLHDAWLRLSLKKFFAFLKVLC